MFFRLGKGITSIIYIFHLKEKPPPEKFKKIKFKPNGSNHFCQNKTNFFKSNKKMSELSVLGKFKHPKNCDMQREFHI